MKKNMVGLIGAMLVLCTSKVMAGNTEEISNGNTGLILSDVESDETQLENLQGYKKYIAQEKMKMSYEIENGLYNNYARSSWAEVAGFTIERQSNKYCCVVACCSAIVNYYTGAYVTDLAIAESFGGATAGATLQQAANYLNSFNGIGTTYVQGSAATNKNTMLNIFYSDIQRFQSPLVISTKFTKGTNWPYTINAHSMCVYGINSEHTVVGIADPYVQYEVPGHSMKYTVTGDEAASAVSSRGNGYLY